MNEKNSNDDAVSAFFKLIQSQDLEQKKVWYSTAAEAYNQARPNYPQQLINRVLELTQISSHAKILEIGCGPGIATKDFAPFGFSMVCVEPNPEFCQFARENCVAYPNVEIINTSFEEWELESEKFDAVLAASSIHWVSEEVRYQKVAEALKESGFLILLWNVVTQPQYEIYQKFKNIYQIHAPSLAEFEEQRTQKEYSEGVDYGIINLGKKIIDSGKFKELIYEITSHEITYKTNDYLTLLSSLSSYIALDSQTKDNLFENLRTAIDIEFGGNITCSYHSAFQIVRKV
ncbi:hypothetical protein NIES4101_77420 [Calothrix sp. NIES-4101]|nr:hypothetical protein NIES4101_77420 [Calothrix sp. NIES-4101]